MKYDCYSCAIWLAKVTSSSISRRFRFDLSATRKFHAVVSGLPVTRPTLTMIGLYATETNTTENNRDDEEKKSSSENFHENSESGHWRHSTCCKLIGCTGAGILLIRVVLIPRVK
jgi:hypothetical protein